MSTRVAPAVSGGIVSVRRITETLPRIQAVPVIAAAILGTLILAAVLAPYVAPHSPLQIDLSNVLAPPVYAGGSWTHPLGTDNLGRDILSRVIYGGRVSLVLAGLVIVIGATVGTALGLLSGYVLGVFDAVVQRLVEAILSLPTIMVALVFVFVLGQSSTSVVIILSPFIAARFARMVRGAVLAIRNQPFVDLARIAGASRFRILVRHILPNVAGTIIVLATLDVGHLILLESSLSFLGVGVPAPTPEWGLMVSEGRSYVSTEYWLSLFPGLAIVVTVLSLNLLGDWLTDFLDPKRRAASTVRL